MGKPIYVFYRMKPTAAFLQLSKEERGRVRAGMGERNKKAGTKHIIILDTYWSNEDWYWAGVAEFPDIDALQQFERDQREANNALYVTSEIMLGTKFEES